MEKISRRSFFKKVAAAGVVVAAAGSVKSVISATIEPGNGACAKYAGDIASQEKAVKENQLVPMTEAEKQKRLDDLLNIHYQEVA